MSVICFHDNFWWKFLWTNIQKPTFTFRPTFALMSKKSLSNGYFCDKIQTAPWGYWSELHENTRFSLCRPFNSFKLQHVYTNSAKCYFEVKPTFKRTILTDKINIGRIDKMKKRKMQKMQNAKKNQNDPILAIIKISSRLTN